MIGLSSRKVDSILPESHMSVDRSSMKSIFRRGLFASTTAARVLVALCRSSGVECRKASNNILAYRRSRTPIKYSQFALYIPGVGPNIAEHI